MNRVALVECGITNRQKVDLFSQAVFHIFDLHKTYVNLFHPNESRRLMEDRWKGFFLMVQSVLHKILILEMAKVTDPARSCGRENLTAKNLLECLEWSAEARNTAEEYVAELDRFRGFLKEARDRILAHSDLGTAIEKRTLGSFEEEDGESFLSSLKLFCELARKTVGMEQFGQIAVGGEVSEIHTALRKAKAFDYMLKEASGENKLKIYHLLRNQK